ncbi:MAG: MFS transporter [Actinomycetia bacterium]|nr:MFS transporter [Actinomycetes bacterium]
MTAESVIDEDYDREAIQHRTLAVLFASSTLGRAGMSISFAVSALLIKQILDDETWAGSSTAAVTIGTAFSASILSGYMNRNGRRPGLTIGFLVATVGGLVAVFGGQKLFLAPYLIGIALIGVGQGATTLARYAAADLALPAKRAKAISWVVFASTVGAVGGPALVEIAGDIAVSFDLDELVGPFLFSTGFFALGALVLWVGLRPDPLVVSGGLRKTDSTSKGGFIQGASAIMASPTAKLATIGLVVSQAVMVMVMAMTPLHMDAHGHEIGIIGLVISAHTAGMFAFAPLAGWASDRFGRVPTLVVGAAQLVAATVLTALAGQAPALLMFPGLFLLGLGWSFGMVSSSALLTEAIEGDDQVPAQGAADFVTSFSSGVGALASGFVFTMAGFHVLSMIGIMASGLVLVYSLYRYQLQSKLTMS